MTMSRENSIISWAEGVAEAGEAGSFMEGFGNDSIFQDSASMGENSFGRKLKAAVDADKAAAEAQVAAAEAQKAAAEAATIARARNDDLEDCIRIQKPTSRESVDGQHGSSAPSTRNNRDFSINEILAKPDANRSVSSISQMDLSLHPRENQPSSGSPPVPARTHARSIAPLHLPFPVALHTLLRENPCPSAICWNKKGTKVKIHVNHPEYKNVLKHYFGQEGSKFSNFRRKANRWRFRFKCLDKDEALYCLQNEQFSRDKDPICSEICPTEAEAEAEAKNSVQGQAIYATHFPSNTLFVQRNTRSSSGGTIPTFVTATANNTIPTINPSETLPTRHSKKRKISVQITEITPSPAHDELAPPKVSDELADWLAGATV